VPRTPYSDLGRGVEEVGESRLSNWTAFTYLDQWASREKALGYSVSEEEGGIRGDKKKNLHLRRETGGR
jgi:hypothetical protein